MKRRRQFRFGVINETMAAASQWLDCVRRTEDWGYDVFLIRDHFVPDVFGDQYAPIAALMAAAMVTRSLRVGTMVLDNDYRHPVLLAKEAATVDVLSGGRFELGMGAGWLRAEYAQAGIVYDSPGTRIERLEESLQIIKGLWSAAPITFTGHHYQIKDLDGTPKPVQQPHPPLLLGGGQRRMLTLAGKEATSVGILTTSVASGALIDDLRERLPESVEQKVAWVREAAGSRFDSIELSLIPTVIMTENRRRRTEQLIAERGWGDIPVETVWEMPSILIGTTEQIIEDMLARRERYGFSYYVISDRHAEMCAPLVAGLAGR
ncbi:MAG: TIGR03621 family F420-dependent LLM class oxidoreductase [Caldilineaceae bacterium]|nr:TIGR03621 family F420-dependent LLM class oxidoreductase [Caldilineaceae bacterium]